MGFDKKTKVVLILIFSAVISTAFMFKNQNQTIQIIYFTNPACSVANKTDDLMDEIKNDFGNRVNIRKIVVSMNPDDPPDTEEVKQLREKYRVYSVPTIIINKKEFRKEFTEDNLKEDICRSFMIKPEVCR